MSSVAIGVDLGGTKISAGVVDGNGEILRRAELPTQTDDPSAVCRQIGDLVGRLRIEGATGLGVGAAGIVDHATGEYLFGPNTGLRDVNLVRMIEEVVRLPVVLDNDANCAAWAEHRFGAGRGCENFICVTLGTGIGGGIVAHGRPYRGARGGAGEIGHMVVNPDGPLCGCGRRGCWEQYASGLALERMVREELRLNPESSLSGRSVEELRGPDVARAARAGDRFAHDVFSRFAVWVGMGLGSLFNIFEPERFAIGGGVGRDWDLFGAGAVQAMRDRIEAPDFRPGPEVMPAELGADAGIVGAALLTLEGAGSA